MNGQTGTMSPVSVDGSDWSGLNQYQKSDAPFSPTFSARSNLATPPTSGIPAAPSSAGLPNGSSSQLSDSGNPSPPNSIAARSSDGTLGDQRSRRQRQVEEILAQHYSALRRFLYSSYRDERSNRKSSKAQDKLLRLSPTQFHELSTDVYDELLRRQQATPSPNRPPRPEVPPFLPPRSDFHEKRNQARQKLASLQHQRFRDLASDVFNELERRFPQFPARESRRASPAPSLRGRPPPNGFGPGGYPPPPGSRRSQSRGPPRLGRGYPSGGPPGSPMYPPRKMSLSGAGINGEGPTAKSFQSNTIVPNKSTMVEDDEDAAGTEDDYDSRSDAFALDSFIRSRRGTGTTIGDGEKKLLAETQSQVSTLQEKISKLEELLKTKDEEISKFQEDRQEVDKLKDLLKAREEELAKYQQDQDKSQISNAERQEWDEIKYELENKIQKAEDLNSSLQLELEKVRADHAAVERDLQEQLSRTSGHEGGDAELQAQFADLEIRHQKLQAELREQQQVTEEVRRETAGFLTEMKELSEQSHSRLEHEERLSEEVHRLEDELNTWKSRYAKAKAQLRHLRASSAGILELRSDVKNVVRDNEFLADDGLIKDVHITKFQISIDELLRIARSDDHQNVMQQIKAVVISVRHILQDVQAKQSDSAERAEATSKVSATANNLITASKNFASSSGLSPISLLDAAASHMSTAVIQLIRIVKIRPTPAEELNDDEDDEQQFAQMKSPDYFSVAPSRSRVSNGSIYSAMSPPTEPENVTNGLKQGYPVEQENHELQELKFYVEDQADGLVQSIQSLVASIRGEGSMTTIRTHVSAIASIVTSVSSSTEHLINRPETDPALRQRAGASIETLEYQRSRLVSAAAEGEGATDPGQFRFLTNQLPPIAFEIARETKDLVQRLDPTDHSVAENDDFR